MSEAAIQVRGLGEGDEAAFRRAIRENRAGDPDWPFAFGFGDSTDYAVYLGDLEAWSRGRGLPDGWVPNTYLVGFVGEVIVGRVSIRHQLNDYLSRVGGHIGYGVIPSYRGRGYATVLLREALLVTAVLGIPRVLLTCDDDNLASARVIEKNGGVFEGRVRDPGLAVPKRRYWIDLSGRP